MKELKLLQEHLEKLHTKICHLVRIVKDIAEMTCDSEPIHNRVSEIIKEHGI